MDDRIKARCKTIHKDRKSGMIMGFTIEYLDDNSEEYLDYSEMAIELVGSSIDIINLDHYGYNDVTIVYKEEIEVSYDPLTKPYYLKKYFSIAEELKESKSAVNELWDKDINIIIRTATHLDEINILESKCETLGINFYHIEVNYRVHIVVYDNNLVVMVFANKIIFPEALSNLLTDGFHKLPIRSIRSIKLENVDTSKVRDISHMFRGLQLKNLNFSKFDFKNITNVDGLFNESVISKTNLSSLNLSNVTSLSNMFYRARVDILDLSDWDTSNVTDVSNIFSESVINILKAPNLNLSKVTNIDKIFYKAEIKDLMLSSWKTQNIISMHSTFEDAKIGELNLSDWDVSNVTDMSNMFLNLKVDKFDLSNWRALSIEDMYNTFNGVCKNVFYSLGQESCFKLDLSKWNVSHLKNIENAFSNANISYLDISNWNLKSDVNMRGMFKTSTIYNLKANNIVIGHNSDLSESFYRAGLKGSELKNWIIESDVKADNMFKSAYISDSDFSNWDKKWLRRLYQANNIYNVVLYPFKNLNDLAGINIGDTNRSPLKKETIRQFNKLSQAEEFLKTMNSELFKFGNESKYELKEINGNRYKMLTFATDKISIDTPDNKQISIRINISIDNEKMYFTTCYNEKEVFPGLVYHLSSMRMTSEFFRKYLNLLYSNQDKLLKTLGIV